MGGAGSAHGSGGMCQARSITAQAMRLACRRHYGPCLLRYTAEKKPRLLSRAPVLDRAYQPPRCPYALPLPGAWPGGKYV
eukprot:7354471-Prymnesium_polylepis.1